MRKKFKIALSICALTLAVASGALLLYNRSVPKIVFEKGSYTIEAGESFDPLKAVSEVKNASEKDIVIKSPEDISSPGKYEYLYELNGKTYTLLLTVADTKAPVLTPKDNLSFLDNEKLTAESLVEVKDKTKVLLTTEPASLENLAVGDYSALITAKDEGGNTSSLEVSFSVVPHDTTPPVIYGAENISVEVGSSFDFLSGVSASDDEDVSPKLDVDYSAVDLNSTGTYTAHYTASDASGNTARVDRTITVRQKSKYFYPSSNPDVCWDAAGIDGQPYLVAVNRAMCTVTVYSKDENGYYTVPYTAFACSVGREGHETITGVYQTQDRYDWCYMVDGSWGRYAIRIDGGYMFHSVCHFSQSVHDLEYDEFNKLGSPASLGCVRLCVRDIKWLYDNCPYAFRTVIYDDATSPGPLGKPGTIKIDTSDVEKRIWDPTDPDPSSPWNI